MQIRRHTRMGLSTVMFFATIFMLTAYFVFAAIQGDFGHFKRIQIVAEEKLLQRKLDQLKSEHAEIANLTRRLSDDYLDLDLLDEQARKRLGYARVDEVIIR